MRSAGNNAADDGIISNMNDTLSVGLIGAGRLGGVIGRLAEEAGHDVLVADRPDSPHFSLVLGSLLPSARILPQADVLARADVVVLALPQSALPALDLTGVRGVVVDATNAWDAAPAAGPGTRIGPDWWAARWPGVPVVKTLNHLGYTKLLADARPAGAPGRRAMAVAADDAAALARGTQLVDSLGFDPVPAPAAAAGLLEPGGALFGGRFDADGMAAVLRG